MKYTLQDTAQGDIALLDDPAAHQLLHSTEMAHLAYNWTDGTPRSTAIWFHWNGSALVVSSPAAAPKTRAISSGTSIAITIDDSSFPYSSLNMRGAAQVDHVDGVAPEYRAAARRYLGDDQAEAWCDQLPPGGMTRISLTPDWVALIVLDDFRRIPSALAG
jgi:hypothetical protein